MTPSDKPTQTRSPRRIVMLVEGENSDIETVLKEYAPPEPTGTRLHGDLQELAAENTGKMVAAEWHGPLGWTRFLWCKR